MKLNEKQYRYFNKTNFTHKGLKLKQLYKCSTMCLKYKQIYAFGIELACWQTSFATSANYLQLSQNISPNHLPLSCLDVLKIESTFLEMSKPQLCWCRCIAVWCTQNHLKTQMIDTRPRFGATMVRSTIHQHNNAVSPASLELTGKDLRKSRQEHHHDVLICVTLRQRQPCMTS